MKSRSRKFILSISLLIIFQACTPTYADELVSENDISEPTFTAGSIATQTPLTTITPTPTPATLQSQVCSPLEGEELIELPEITTQLFIMPRAGQDDGHHGIDFAFYRRKDLLSIDGVQVLSALGGEVKTIINDQNPYGNAIIIETSLNSIDKTLLDKISIPSIQPTVVPDPKFVWSDGELPFQLSETDRSIYTLYAHLKNPSELKTGDIVACGQPIGYVGNTGDSSNPHLHFETRVGPSGARFESMAYYSAQSTQSERYNYVVWRVSNLFQPFDPMKLLSVNE
jgi:murein DD-endopeptidase MepM/ murein hydrolase activator NlpD